MLPEIRDKIRALVSDFDQNQTEPFTYSGDNKFALCGNNTTSISNVTVNGNDLSSGQTYDFDSDTNILTIDGDLNTDDLISVSYVYNNYSDTELDAYIKSSLVWLSIYSYCTENDFEIEEEDIYPTPSNREEDLIAFIASILIKPDYNSYKLPNLTVSYPRTMPKEKRIEELVIKFRRGLGKNDVLTWIESY